MQKTVLRLAALTGVLLTLGACADSPTQSDRQRAPGLAAPSQDGQVAPQGCVIDGLCVLPPISGGPTCDPWEDLNWCRDDECMSSQPGTGDPEFVGIAGCPGGGGAPPGGGTPPPPGGEQPVCPMSDAGSCLTLPDSVECEECNPPEAESTICPQPFIGNTQPALITVAGRNHEFQFHSSLTYPFKRLTGGRSPATYEIGLPTTSRDSWWIAERGTITVWCRGAWITRRHWIGTMTVLDSDLHMVMGPGHPDF